MNFRTLDLNLLRVFDAVMTEGSLTRAAEHLAMTQPAVSNALKRLRESLGQDLLIRTARGVRPTGFGEALWPEVRNALGQLRAALQPGAYDPAADDAHFHIAMADATSAVLLPPLMARLESAAPRAQVTLVPLTTSDPRPMLELGEADLAVGYFPEVIPSLKAQESQAVLRHERLTESQYMCVMRRDHALANSELTLDAYCSARHVRVSFSGRGRSFIDQALASLNRTRSIAITVNQFFAAARVVAHTDLLTVFPRGFMPVVNYGDRLIARTLPFPAGGVHVDALWHLRHDTHAAHVWLRSQLREAAQDARIETREAGDSGFGLPLA